MHKNRGSLSTYFASKSLNMQCGYLKPMVSKKGDLSLNFIIIAILALIVLIIIALFFTGGMTKLFGTEKEVSELTLTPQIKALAEQSCNLHCTNQDENAYSSPSFSADMVEAGYSDCEDILGKPFSDCESQETCQKEDPASAVQCTGTFEATCEQIPGCEWQ